MNFRTEIIIVFYMLKKPLDVSALMTFRKAGSRFIYLNKFKHARQPG